MRQAIKILLLYCFIFSLNAEESISLKKTLTDTSVHTINQSTNKFSHVSNDYLELKHHPMDRAIGQSMRVFVDEMQGFDITKIKALKEQDWKKINEDILNYGFKKSAIWLRLHVKNNIEYEQRLLLSIENPSLDHVWLYVVEHGINTELKLGDHHPLSNRPIFNRYFIKPLLIAPNETIEVFIRVSNLGSLQIPVYLKTETSHQLSEQYYLLIFGVYFGILLIMSIYNAILYMAIKDKSYLHFSVSIFTNVLFQLALYGFGFQFIWPNYESINLWMIPTANALFYASSTAFIASFIGYKNIKHQHQILLKSIMYLSILLAFISPFIAYEYAVVILTVMAIPFSITGVLISFNALLGGKKSARFFLWSWIVFAISVAILSINKMGYLPRNIFTEHSMHIGNVLSVLFMSIALADRIYIEKKERIKSDKEKIRLEKLARLEQKRYLQIEIDRKNLELIAQQDIVSAKKEVLLAKAQSETKSSFLATMSHEIRTPLNGILGVSDILQETSLDNKQKEYLNLIKNSGKSLLNIINDVLDFSKIEAGKMEVINAVFDLHLMTKETMDNFYLLAKNKNITIQYQFESCAPIFIRSDINRIQQILLNLVGNSMKFAEKGSICLRVSLVENSTKEKPLVKFEVIDDGIGISKVQQQKLFKTFSQADGSTTRKYGGTGLGLSISKRLVEMMNGEIGVISEKGKGATFWFTIQSEAISTFDEELAKQTSKTTPKLNGVEYENAFKGLNVLIAEDNNVNQIVIANMAKRLGLSFHIVENGEQALDYVKEYYKVIDMVWMDCEMPIMDGYDATSKIREWENDNKVETVLPIFALTAHALDEHKKASLKAGMSGHIAKPVSLKLLYNSIIANSKISDMINH